MFFGLLGGYIIAITGHRKGVVINMTTEEIETAEKTKGGARTIRVSTNMIKKIRRIIKSDTEVYALINQLVEQKKICLLI